MKEQRKTQLRLGPDEADVDAEAAMHGGAIDAEEDPVRHRRPSRVLRITIEAHLKFTAKTQTNQNHITEFPDLNQIQTKTNPRKEKYNYIIIAKRKEKKQKQKHRPCFLTWL